MQPSDRPLLQKLDNPKAPLSIQWFAAIVLTLLSVSVHAAFASKGHALWRDEANSVGLATMPSLMDLWMGLSSDSSPVLWPFLMRLWIYSGAGDSDASLRLLGFFSQLLILASVWFAVRSISKTPPILSLLLIGLSPAFILWPSLRAYGLGAAMVIFTMGCLWRGIEQPGVKWKLLTGLCAVVAAQCLYTNILFLGAVCAGGMVACLLRNERKQCLWIGAVLFVAAASLVVYVPTLQRIAPWQKTTLIIVTPTSVGDSLRAALNGPVNGMSILWRLLSYGFIGGALYWIVERRTKRAPDSASDNSTDTRSRYAYVFTTVVLAASVYFVFLARAGRAMYDWHFVGIMVLGAVCIDVGWAQLTSLKWLRPAYACISVVLAGLLLPFALKSTTIPRTNVNVVAASLSRLAAPGDLILCSPFQFGVTFRRYYSGKAAWLPVPPVRDSVVQRYDSLAELMTKPEVLGPRVEEPIRKTLNSGHKIWLVGNFPQPPAEKPEYVLPDQAGPRGWYCPRYEVYSSRRIAYYIAGQGAARTPIQLPEMYKAPMESCNLELVNP